MKWTVEQQSVIDARGRNILVSAAAGSGKTAVLTARILGLLQEGADLDEFLVITFTKASAKDMKRKIRKAIAQTQGLQKQLKKVNGASISTIHSFCHQLVREQFYNIPLDPAFRMEENHELNLLGEEILEDLLNRYYDREDASVLELEEIFGSDRSDWGLREVLKRLENFLANQVNPDAYVERVLASFQDRKGWQARYQSYVQEQLEEAILLLDSAEAMLFNEKQRDVFEKDRLTLLALHPEDKFMRWPSLSQAEKDDDLLQAANERMKKRRNSYKALHKKIAAYASDFESHFMEFQAQAQRVEALLRLGMIYFRRFALERRAKKVLSYADLEHLALQILSRKEVAEMYRQRYRYIFIDEYQDTSPVQEALIKTFCRQDNRFMVGDVKQSIYSFRQADPSIFLEKYHAWAEADEGSKRIDLNRNFRSAPGIIRGVNALFSQLMRKEFGGIAYDDKTRLILGNESLANLEEDVEFLVVQEGPSQVEAEVEMILRRIAMLRQQGYAYRDMVILARSHRRLAEVAEPLFRKAGVPLFLDYSPAYLETLEVSLLLNYLKLIDNFKQDVPLLSLLRLPRYGLSDQQLYDLRAQSPKGALYEALLNPALSSEIRDKLGFFLDEMQEFRRLSRRLGLDELLQEIYHRTHFESFMMGLKNPKIRLANVRLLFKIARDYEKTSYVGLHRFLKYLERMRESKSDIEGARILSEDADAVRLMTIHKSKGLQFPVVFIAELHRRYNEQDSRQALLLGRDSIIMNSVDLSERTKKKPFFKVILEEEIKMRQRQEEIRLLYVAMTRAEEKLILSGVIKEKEAELLAEQPEALSGYHLRNSARYLDLLLHSGILHETGFQILEEQDLDEIALQERSFDVKTSGFIPDKRVFEKGKFAGKYAVSALIRESTPMPQVRREIQETTPAGIKRGIQFHKAMEWIDLSRPWESLQELEADGVLKDFDDEPLLRTFLHHPRLKQWLEQSTSVEREIPFVLRKKIEEEEILVQGIIDLVIKTQQGDILIDYKTDVSKSFLPRYLKQMAYYAEAWKKLSGREILNCWIWFVRLGELEEVVGIDALV